jgi:hypothetical protein
MVTFSRSNELMRPVRRLMHAEPETHTARNITLAVLLGIVLVGILSSLPDIKRYARISTM